jgi:hypothetical protein
MPVEFSRTTARKRIHLTNGYVDVPIITKISFIDPVKRGQEYQFTVDNSADGDRRIHVEKVNQTGNQAGDGSANFIEVERIDEWRTLDPVSRGQETHYQFDNRTKSNEPPPYFITHDKTHIVRYRGKTNDDVESDNVWIESEILDRFIIVDAVERGQEAQFVLNNPDPASDAAQADPNDPEISDTGNGIDPPWRTDPFQNIVRISGTEVTIFWAYLPETILPGPAVGGGYHFRNVNPLPTDGTVTLDDGRIGVVTGTFPTVLDVIFNPGPGVIFLAFPWWIIGPNTDTDPSAHSGYNYYDNPTGDSFSHTWQFHGYTYQSGLAPAIFVSAGSLSVSFGPVALTVEDVPWNLTNIHVAFTAIPESDFGATPTNMGWQPFFSATFEPPTA